MFVNHKRLPQSRGSLFCGFLLQNHSFPSQVYSQLIDYRRRKNRKTTNKK